jgi:hypothetical protein
MTQKATVDVCTAEKTSDLSLEFGFKLHQILDVTAYHVNFTYISLCKVLYQQNQTNRNNRP